jgi:hypothetical protein
MNQYRISWRDSDGKAGALVLRARSLHAALAQSFRRLPPIAHNVTAEAWPYAAKI